LARRPSAAWTAASGLSSNAAATGDGGGATADGTDSDADCRVATAGAAGIVAAVVVAAAGAAGIVAAVVVAAAGAGIAVLVAGACENASASSRRPDDLSAPVCTGRLPLAPGDFPV